jgi:formiminotetrahydrofolate cyclodeaminase
MERIADLTVGAFADALAAQTSTPGGGGAAAVMGSQAAALVSMVINFTVGKKKYAAVEEEFRRILARSEELRRELLALADADAAAFDGVSATYSMPKETEEQAAARTAALQAALKHAAEIPFVTAEKCLEVIELAAPVGAGGNPNVVSDAGTAIYLAHAAVLAGLLNVNVNLKLIKDPDFVAEWSAKRDDLLGRTVAAVHAARAACTATLGVAV